MLFLFDVLCDVPGEVPRGVPGDVMRDVPGEVPHAIPGDVLRDLPLDLPHTTPRVIPLAGTRARTRVVRHDTQPTYHCNRTPPSS